jgi:hypothetical protein
MNELKQWLDPIRKLPSYTVLNESAAHLIARLKHYLEGRHMYEGAIINVF